MKKIFPVRIQLLALLLLTLLCYVNTFQHEYSLDDFLLSDNLPPVEAGWAGTLKVFESAYNFFDYRPVAVFTYAVEQQILGELRPGVSHVVNVFLYFICVLVLFGCLRSLPVKNAEWIAFFTAVIFIVHPIHSNVVSSLKNRDAILSLTLGLCSIWLALGFINYTNKVRARQILVKALLLLGAVVVFLVSTTAKLDAVSFIIILPLTVFIFARNRIWLLLSGGLAFGIYSAFRYIRMQIITPRFLESTTIEESILVTENTMMLYDTVSVKISAALISLFYYLKFHIVPTGYYYYFGYNMIPVDQLVIWQNILALVTGLIALAAFIYYFLKRPEISFAIGFFFGGLAYCLNIYTPIAGIVAPRLAFIASVGFCMLAAILLIGIGGLLHKRFLRESRRWTPDHVSLVLVTVLVLFYIPFTIHRTADWKNLWTLIEADIEHLDDSFEAQRIACMNYLDKSKWVTEDEEALRLLRKSLNHCTLASKVFPEDQFVEETIGLAQFKLGNYQQSYNQFQKVLNNFERTEIANEYIGDMFMYRSRPDSAAYYFRQLLEIAPDYDMAYVKFNRSMVENGRVDEAISVNKEFMAEYPRYFFAQEGLGYLSLVKGDTVAAVNYFFMAIDRGSAQRQYIESLHPYFEKHGKLDQLDAFYAGERLPVEP